MRGNTLGDRRKMSEAADRAVWRHVGSTRERRRRQDEAESWKQQLGVGDRVLHASGGPPPALAFSPFIPPNRDAERRRAADRALWLWGIR